MSFSQRDINVRNDAIVTVPGAGATVVLFDTTANPGTGVTLYARKQMPDIKRAVVTIETDQAATFFTAALATSSSTFDIYNGGGSGEPIAANTFFERDVRLLGDDTKIYVVTGTAPGVWRVTVKLSTDQALGQ